MIISEKQIMQLIESVKEYSIILDTHLIQSEEYRDKQKNLISTIINQQSEELKGIE